MWFPGRGQDAEEPDALDYDPTAYDCLVPVSFGWPSLSFDWLPDGLGPNRVSFPHSVTLVTGSQAPSARQNVLTVARVADIQQGRHGRKRSGKGASRKDKERGDGGAMKAQDGSATRGKEGMDAEGANDDEDEDDSESDDSGSESDASSSSSSDSDDPDGVYARDPAPEIHVRQMSHLGGVNRVRASPHAPGAVAAWSDEGEVCIHDVSELLAEVSAEPAEMAVGRPNSASTNALRPRKAKIAHRERTAVEGWGLAWSPVEVGALAAGDLKGRIHLLKPRDASGASFAAASAPLRGHLSSVEDIAWSPAEPGVLASAGADGTVRIWDHRVGTKPMLGVRVSDSDVNVLSWNGQTSHLLATGGDDGVLRVWDLRSFSAQAAQIAQTAQNAQNALLTVPPVASLTHHRAPICSLEWSPHDPSVLLTASEDHSAAVWDLAVERDPEEEAALGAATNADVPEDVPPQLLFVHAGQRDPKEAHWHPSIPGLIGCTAGDGFNLYKPANVAELPETA